MDIAEAELIAARLMQWLAMQPDYMLRFCESAGVVPIDLLTRGDEPEVLGGLLDFLLSDDALVQEFCMAYELEHDVPAQARACLPGAMPLN